MLLGHGQADDVPSHEPKRIGALNTRSTERRCYESQVSWTDQILRRARSRQQQDEIKHESDARF
jgi:hypothetical protein